jgi:hypothetical protein
MPAAAPPLIPLDGVRCAVDPVGPAAFPDVVVSEVAMALLEVVVGALEVVVVALGVVVVLQSVVLRTVTPTGVQMPWTNWMVAAWSDGLHFW